MRVVFFDGKRFSLEADASIFCFCFPAVVTSRCCTFFPLQNTLGKKSILHLYIECRSVSAGEWLGHSYLNFVCK